MPPSLLGFLHGAPSPLRVLMSGCSGLGRHGHSHWRGPRTSVKNLGPAEAFLSSRGVSFQVRNAKCEIPTWTPHLCADACRVCSVSPPGDCHAPQTHDLAGAPGLTGNEGHPAQALASAEGTRLVFALSASACVCGVLGQGSRPQARPLGGGAWPSRLRHVSHVRHRECRSASPADAWAPAEAHRASSF